MINTARGTPRVPRCEHDKQRTILVKTHIIIAIVLTVFFAPVAGARIDQAPELSTLHQSSLEQKVKDFELVDESLIDGIAKLSQLPIELHFGVEEILGSTFTDRVAREVRFSIKLQDQTVSEILDALCRADSRYVWSTDGNTVNVYPRTTVNDDSLLPNMLVKRIEVTKIGQPEDALTFLVRQLPKQDIGDSSLGGDSRYAEPWTASFENITVRQFINRIAEHMGPRTSWFWHGIKNEAYFTFLKGSVNTERQGHGQR